MPRATVPVEASGRNPADVTAVGSAEPTPGPSRAGRVGSAESEPATFEPAGAGTVLPEPVRQRIIALAAAALPGLPADEMPVPLRRVAKFAPNRRARLGGPAIAAQLAADPLFRQRISRPGPGRRR